MDADPVGYVYAADVHSGAMKAARAGIRAMVENRRPPFIVVDSRIDHIIVARWPGHLWLVRIAEALTPDDDWVASAGFVRAVAVDVISEIPAWKLFGDHGESVCAVIEQASALDPDRVNALVQQRDSSAGDAYSRAFNSWLRHTNKPALTDDLTGVLRLSNRGSGSPINCGFSVIHRAVRDRAEAVVGDSAFLHEDGETYLEPIWSAAANALLEAAMAFGAASVSGDNDRRIMSAAWHRVVGPSPLNSLA